MDTGMSNAEQIEYWNGRVGDTWADMQERMDLAFTPVTAALLAAAAPAPGEDVLDIGCGSGETSLALAAAVGEDGFVTGVDISAPLLDRARARSEGLDIDIEFVEADAATFDEGQRDLIISRFGVMFFADPVAAFANIRSLAVAGGRLAFVCWQVPAGNRWATLPAEVLADVVAPDPRYDPLAPGPFAFADPERVTGILVAAGWPDVALVPLTFPMLMGDGADAVAAAVEFAMRIGPTARAVREAGPEVAGRARARLAEAFPAYLRDGIVALDAAAWVVTARA